MLDGGAAAGRSRPWVSLPNPSSTGQPANLAQEVSTGAASFYILALRARRWRTFVKDRVT